MSTPTPDEVYAHEWKHGGLWRVIPRRIDDSIKPPLCVQLTVSVGTNKPSFIWINGVGLVATIEENNTLQGAEWVPVDWKGDRV